LKAYCAWTLSGSIVPRPRSVDVAPMSWKPLSVKFQPLWHPAQAALPTKSLKPRLAESETAFSSPSTHSSNGA
jgi:hypothetical protein